MSLAFSHSAPFPPYRSPPPLLIKSSNETISISSFTPNHPNSKHQTLHSSSNATVSSPQPTLLFNEWPQLLKTSIVSGDLSFGQAIHACLIKSNSHTHLFEGNNLVNLYAKFNKLDDANKVFDEMLEKNTITWTSLMRGYLQCGEFNFVFDIAKDMSRFGEVLNEHTCSVLLQACNFPGDQIRGEQIHGFAIKSGLEDDNVVLGTSLICMYSRTGYLDYAEKMFNDITNKDVQCLNFMILEYGKAGYVDKAMQVFIYLLSVGFEPTVYTLTNIITTCNENLGMDIGRLLHGLAIKYGFSSATSIGNAVITMYGKYEMVEEAERMFSQMGDKNLISWTALMSVYARNGLYEQVIDKFLVLVKHGSFYDSSCLATVLDACSECYNVDIGLQLHGFAVKVGTICDSIVGTALVDLYAKCGDIKYARTVYDRLSCKSITSFNAFIAGFLEMDGDDRDGIMVLFRNLRLEGIGPDSVTFSRLLSVFSKQACLGKGKCIHAYTIKTGFEDDLTVSNALVTLYAKCGSIEEACKTFNAMNTRDIVSCNAMVSAYAIHGKGEEALALFEEMKRLSYTPDGSTISAVLQACNYSGLLQHGLTLFNDIESKYRVRPEIEHFACLVDLLGRAGKLSEAVGFIYKSSFADTPLLWRALVNVCKLRGDLSIGVLASKRLLELAPENAESYILVSNMYAGERMCNEAANVRTTMNDMKLSKEVGCSWIEIEAEVHCFVASDKNHRESGEIYKRLNLLRHAMEVERYDKNWSMLHL